MTNYWPSCNYSWISGSIGHEDDCFVVVFSSAAATAPRRLSWKIIATHNLYLFMATAETTVMKSKFRRWHGRTDSSQFSSFSLRSSESRSKRARRWPALTFNCCCSNITSLHHCSLWGENYWRLDMVYILCWSLAEGCCCCCCCLLHSITMQVFVCGEKKNRIVSCFSEKKMIQPKHEIKAVWASWMWRISTIHSSKPFLQFKNEFHVIAKWMIRW